jgi:hypothetical protein
MTDTTPTIVSIFLGNIHHAYAQTDGTYAFPNSREGDMLKQAVRELAAMREERDEARRLYLASTFSEDEIIHEMKRHGWDCFKEDGKPCQ